MQRNRLPLRGCSLAILARRRQRLVQARAWREQARVRLPMQRACVQAVVTAVASAHCSRRRALQMARTEAVALSHRRLTRRVSLLQVTATASAL